MQTCALMSSKAPDIQRRREDLGLSIIALATQAQVNRGTLSTLESGETDPHPNTLRKLRDALSEEEARRGVTWPPPETEPVQARPYTLGIRLQGDIEIIGHPDTGSERDDLVELVFYALGRSLGREAIARLQQRLESETG